MMSITTVLSVALAAMTPAVPANIEVVRADFAAYQRLNTEHLALPSGEMVGRVERILADRQCVIAGQSARRFNIRVNYAVQIEDNGDVSRIIVEDIGCRPLELLVGRTAADIVAQGHLRTASPATPGWHASRIDFNLR